MDRGLVMAQPKCEPLYAKHEAIDRVWTMFFAVYGDDRRVHTIVCNWCVGSELSGFYADKHFNVEAQALTNHDYSDTETGVLFGFDYYEG